MAAAPVNPSDFGSWMRPGAGYPKCVGNEGAGTVVAYGGGFLAWRLVGKKVGVLARDVGSYQQYVVVDAMTGAWRLDPSIAVEDAASFFVNPFTAVGIIDTVKQKGASAFVHTGASSQLGQMLVKLCPSQSMTVVSVVRREEQAKMLRELGATHVVVQTDGWEAELGKVIKDLNIKIAFDCIAGETTGLLMSLLPDRSTVFLYGALSEKPAGGFQAMDMIYRKKRVEGWLLPNWLQAGGLPRQFFRARRALKLVNQGLKDGGWAQSQFDDVSMERWFDKFLSMRTSRGFTGSKLRIRLDQ
jgi:NADPH:quinone reductase-like Zn-dependent oxidoreductase